MTTAVRRQESGAATDHTVRHRRSGQPARDARYLALRNFAISITALNVLGYTLLGFEQPWLWPIVALITGYSTEIVFETIGAWANRRPPRYRGSGTRGFLEFLLPAHITSLAVNMLIYTNNQIWPVVFGVVVGVAGKHVLQAPISGRMRHYMNPSNLGIIVTLVCFSSWVCIAPAYEFSENANTLFRLIIPIAIAIAGTLLNATLTRRMPLIIGWIGGFAIQACARHWIWHVSLYQALGVTTGIAFVLFTNYMITDPGTTPMKARPQFIFGAAVATAYGVLMLFNVVYTLFFATTVICALRGLGWWAAHLVNQTRARRAADTATSGDQLRPVPG